MSVSEARRHDLYNGLNDLLGPERADTLMAFLPTDTRIASKADLEGLEMAFAVRMDRFEASLNEVNRRLDRFYVTMVTALMGMFATLVAGMLFV